MHRGFFIPTFFSYFLIMLLSTAFSSHMEDDGGRPFVSISSDHYESLSGLSHQEKHQQAARHLVRPLIRKNCFNHINQRAQEHFPPARFHKGETFRGYRYFLHKNDKELCQILKNFYTIGRLNAGIIQSLQGNPPKFRGYEGAFKGVKEHLEAAGFYLDDQARLCKSKKKQ